LKAGEIAIWVVGGAFVAKFLLDLWSGKRAEGSDIHLYPGGDGGPSHSSSDGAADGEGDSGGDGDGGGGGD
jgi:hypothetical protein